MHRRGRRYISYLLRLWQVRTGSELVWRASLESPQTGDRTGFASLEDLFAFLQQQTGAVSGSGGDDEVSEIGEEGEGRGE